MSSDADRSGEISRDLVFEILSSARRRMILYYLRQHDGTATVNELADQIAAWENDVEPEELSSQQRKRVYVSLYQTHLPKLASAEIIDYDDDEGTVEIASRASEIDTFLTPATESTYPWQLHYLVLTAISALLFVLAVAEIPGVPSVTLVGIGFVVAFALSSVAHYRSYRRRKNEIPTELGEHER
jgi:DNA-binding transcriptional ArsR family regulator